MNYLKVLLVGVLISICTLVSSDIVSDRNGVVTQVSAYSVAETADRFEAILAKKGLTQFARINHAENAKTVDLTLRPTILIVFGNPKVGTPLMQCQQMVALDLPQKVLFWQNEDGQVQASYNDPAYLKSRHKVSGCDPVFIKIGQVLSKLVSAAAMK